MKLTVNAAGFNNSVQMGTKDGQSVRTVKNAAFGGATKLGEDPVAKRREEARRQAWKVVENAWKNDRSVDDTIQSHRDSYAELENRKKGALAAIDETNQQKEALREQCGVDADSQEQQDLLLLEKEQDYKNGVLDEGLTDEEYDRLAKMIIDREKSGRGFNFFHFMIDLEGGPCLYKRLSGCGSGTEYLAVTPWGDFYPCHQFVGDENFLMGNVNEGITRPEIADEFRCCNVYTKEKCKKCFARFYCSGGCMANAYKYADGLNDSYDLGCEMERKRVECAIMIKAAMADEN